jgi:membrane protein YqaA with SNARE-associated domain
LRWIRTRIDQWWYLPLLGLLAGLDMFVWVVPTDFLVITTAVVRPGRWIRTGAVVALGSALGMLVFAYGIEWGGPWFRRLFESVALTEVRWTDAAAVSQRRGPWAVFLVCLNPVLPPQAAIALAVISGMKPLAVFCSALAGRLCKYGLYTLIAAKAPRRIWRDAPSQRPR